MNMRKIAMAVAIMGANLATAAVSDEEAKQLGTTLTPFGAERAGSKDGSIPEYTGGIPFPIAKTGDEMMWNHLLRFHGYHYDFRGKQYVVDRSGRMTMTDEFTAQQEWPYYLENAGNPDIYYRVRSDKLMTRSVGAIHTYY